MRSLCNSGQNLQCRKTEELRLQISLPTLGWPEGERNFPHMQNLSFILVLPSAYLDTPQHLFHSKLFRHVTLHANYYSQGRKKLRSHFHNSSPLIQYLVHTLFSVLYINFLNIALQNSFTLLIPNHWELIQTTEVERVEEAVAMAVCFTHTVLKSE